MPIHRNQRIYLHQYIPLQQLCYDTWFCMTGWWKHVIWRVVNDSVLNDNALFCICSVNIYNTTSQTRVILKIQLLCNRFFIENTSISYTSIITFLEWARNHEKSHILFIGWSFGLCTRILGCQLFAVRRNSRRILFLCHLLFHPHAQKLLQTHSALSNCNAAYARCPK